MLLTKTNSGESFDVLRKSIMESREPREGLNWAMLPLSSLSPGLLQGQTQYQILGRILLVQRTSFTPPQSYSHS